MAAPDAPIPDSLSKLSINRTALAAPTRRRPWWKRWWVWALVIVMLVVAAMSLRARGAPTAVEYATVASAYPSASLTTLNATGRVVAARRASVSSKATGKLEWLGVQEGQQVKAGDVIARVENGDVAAQREQAAANVQAARANYAQGVAEQEDADSNFKRTQELSDKKFISGSALDTAASRAHKAVASVASLKAQIAVAEANLRAANVAYEQTLIKAPFTGLVLTKSANVGDIVTPFSSASGTTGAVVTMADMETLEVEADVSESAIAKISLGQPAEIQLDAYPDLRLTGAVSRVVPTVDRSKATLVVKVSFVDRDPRVLPDMSAKIAFLSRSLKPEERNSVPALRPEAIAKRDGKDVVFAVVKDDKLGGDEHVAIKPVTVGAKVGDLVQVGGLAPGDRVVLNPGEKLQEGGAVTALKK